MKVFLFSRYKPDAKNHTSKDVDDLYNSLIERDINAVIIYTDYSHVEFDDDIQEFVLKNKYSNKIYRIEENDIFFIRVSSINTKNSVRLLNSIEEIKDRYKLRLFNKEELIKAFGDKYLNYLFFKNYNIPTPKTIYISHRSNLKKDKKIIEYANDLGYPLIVKPNEGSLGNGIILIESERQLQSITEMMYTSYKGFLMQEYIESSYDVRVFTYKDNILAVERRNVIEGDFRANASKGADVLSYDLSESELAEVENILGAMESRFGEYGTIGIDFIICNKTGKLYVLELNSSPGYKGISKFTESGDITKDIVNKMIDEGDISEEYMTISKYSKDLKENKISFISESGKSFTGDILEEFDEGFKVLSEGTVMRIKHG